MPLAVLAARGRYKWVQLHDAGGTVQIQTTLKLGKPNCAFYN